MYFFLGTEGRKVELKAWKDYVCWAFNVKHPCKQISKVELKKNN